MISLSCAGSLQGQNMAEARNAIRVIRRALRTYATSFWMIWSSAVGAQARTSTKQIWTCEKVSQESKQDPLNLAAGLLLE